MHHSVRIIRNAGYPRILVWVNEKLITSEKSLKYRNHSPTGFEAGYGGSGPAQLALAILLEVADEDTAQKYYQRFKWHYIAKGPYQEVGTYEFTFTVEEVKELQP